MCNNSQGEDKEETIPKTKKCKQVALNHMSGWLALASKELVQGSGCQVIAP